MNDNPLLHKKHPTFLPCDCACSRMVFLSKFVCPSVCQTDDLWQNEIINYCQNSYTILKVYSSSFLAGKMVGWEDLLYLKFCPN